MPLVPVDRVAVTTVVDNSIDILRPDEKIARHSGSLRAWGELVVSSTGSAFMYGA